MGEEGEWGQANRVIYEMVWEIMTGILGRKGLEGIIGAIRVKYGLELEEIPDKLHILSEALREALSVGSTIVENMIIKKLYTKLGIEFRWREGYKLLDYIDHAKNQILIVLRRAE